MKTIKAIIFDLDNTVLDRRTTFRRFASEFVQTYFSHLDDTQALVDRLIELDEDGYKDKRELFTELFNELPWPHKPSLDELMKFYEKEYVRNAVLMDGARDVLRSLQGKYKIGMITNGRTLIQYGKIDQLGIRDDFDTILVSEEAGVKKPDPRIFAIACERLEVRPEECIFVGDHPVNDIEGAHQTGMSTIWLQVNQPWKEGLQAKPLAVIREFRELASIFNT